MEENKEKDLTLEITSIFTDDEFVESKDEDDLSTVLNELMENLKNKTIIKVVFSETDKKAKCVRGVYKGIPITMQIEEFYGKKSSNPKILNGVIGKEINVLVTYVDFESKSCIVSLAKARMKVKNILLEKIQVSLEKNEYPIVHAIVRKYDKEKNRFVLDIGGVGFLGYVYTNDWDYYKGHDFDEQFEKYKGKTIKVRVLQHYKRKEIEDIINGVPKIIKVRANVRCSRKMTLVNPWDDIEEKLHPQDACTVICRDRKSSKVGFFGVLESNLGIETFTFYEDVPEDVKVVEGVRYVGYVKRIDRERESFVFKPIRIKPYEAGESNGES